MADIKVGISGVTKPTPRWMKQTFNALLYVSGGWALFSNMLSGIPQPILDSIDHYILEGLALLRFTISFFHYDCTEDGN